MSEWVRSLAAAFLLVLVASAAKAVGQEPFITVASTTSPEESALFDHLLPVFTEETGIEIRLVEVGTGPALRIGEQSDCDVVFVHDKPAELAFVEHGFGIDRREVLYNDFILVGPERDPAHIDRGEDIVASLRKISDAKAPFIARGDDSSTSKAEMRLWKAAGIDPSRARGSWYHQTGSGMEQTLNAAAAMDGYTLSDRRTWLIFRDKQSLIVVGEGDPRLLEQYSVILVNPAKHPQVNQDLGRKLINWLTSASAQKAIAHYRGYGAQIFFRPRTACPSWASIPNSASAPRSSNENSLASIHSEPRADVGHEEERLTEMEPIKISLCPLCSECPEVEITDQGVTIGEDTNTVRLTHAEWNELVRLIEAGQLRAV